MMEEYFNKLDLLKEKIDRYKALGSSTGVDKELEKVRKEVIELYQKYRNKLSRWDRVILARYPNRPYTLDFVKAIFSDWVELHGDRFFADDPAIVAGIAKFKNRSVAIIGHQKGSNTKERVYRNFGQPRPEGYRKAVRIMQLAEKFNLPLITFIDTPGAYPGIGAEERGQAEAIARSLEVMALLRTPIVVVVTGEGGSGGALALSLGDKIFMLENAIYSVISPEGCAAILWRTQDKKEEAAENLHLTSYDLKKLGIIDDIIPEPPGGAHMYPEEVFLSVEKYIDKSLRELCEKRIETLIQQRGDRFRSIKFYKE